MALSTIGAILFGLGIILFLAYNWRDMYKFSKLARNTVKKLIWPETAGLFVAGIKMATESGRDMQLE